MRELIEIQEGLAGRVVLQDTFKVPGRNAGVDLAYLESRVFCAAVVLDYDSLEIIEKRCIETEISFPYIPTLLAFREAGPIIDAGRSRHSASHVGVILDVPTIGVAKHVLCGKAKGEIKTGKPVPLIYEGRHVGHVYRSKHCIRGYKLPEPTRLVHILAESEKRKTTCPLYL